MTTTERVLLAAVVVVVDLVAFALPMTGIVAAYVLVARPPWFRRFVEDLYGPSR